VWSLLPGNPMSVGLTPFELTGATKPKYWYEFYGKLGIYPAYTSVSTQSVKVFEALQPSAIAASGTLPTPAVFDTAIEHFVIAMALIKDRQNEFAKGFLDSYQATADRFRLDFIEQPKEAVKPIE
jgi:hypothetical protein